jgi:hypothetical protein
MPKILNRIIVKAPEALLPADSIVLGVDPAGKADGIALYVVSPEKMKAMVTRQIHLVKLGEEVSEMALAAEYKGIGYFHDGAFAVFVEPQDQALARKPLLGR